VKKIGRFYLIFFICIFLLSACVVKDAPELKYEVNAEDAIDLSTDKKAALQQLSQLMQIIKDGTQENIIREKASRDFLELLQSTLSTHDLSAQELSDLQLNIFMCEKQESIQDDISLRFIVFMGYPEIFGTLERTWTFVEIYQGSKKYIQIIYEKTSETPTNCKTIKENGKYYVLLYGGTTEYVPRPLFISFWELSGVELMPGKIINLTDSKEDNVRDYENMLIFEGGQEQWYFDEVMSDLADNPLLSVRLGSKTDIIIFFEEGRLVAQKR
jgi:hypothetical protein